MNYFNIDFISFDNMNWLSLLEINVSLINEMVLLATLIYEVILSALRFAIYIN
jgi:hypothetical protein